MAEAFRLCLAQMLMCNMRLHQFEALRQMSSACVIFLAVGVWLLEWRRFCEHQAWQHVLVHPHWYLAAGVPCTLPPACSFVHNALGCMSDGHQINSADREYVVCAASLGFVLNLLAFAVIKLTGSVTQKVLGTVKNVLLVVFSVLFMGEQVTWHQWLGAHLVLLADNYHHCHLLYMRPQQQQVR